MPDILELLLLDRAGYRSPDRAPLQNLMVGYLVGADHTVALFGKAISVCVAPEDLFSSLLELGVQASRPPIASSVRLQIDVVQNSAARSSR